MSASSAAGGGDDDDRALAALAGAPDYDGRVRKDRGARLARGSAIALFATLVASLAHTLGGGMPPGLLSIALALAFSIPFAAIVVGSPASAGRRARRIRTAAAAGGAQLALHALYSLGTGAAITGVVTSTDATTGHGAHGAHAGHPASAQQVLLPVLPELPASTDGIEHHLGVWMLAAHVGAAALTIAFVLLADHALAALRALGRGLRVALVLAFGAVPVLRRARVRAFGRPVLAAARDLHLVSLRHRGPPSVAAAA
ncbi:hypothetical protein GE115_08590 [Agromyces sp. CFH 90414]|uniref:Uncharacterized protein n=1 Tax=Agromyces agglutinans TaxID=2662258 RepID=A0A6I2FBV2_9MICO|nr:hypothetical protein [Agromyces agglutinans]MRG59926.1 hypothetical protein [Agromyces agglutinans]